MSEEAIHDPGGEDSNKTMQSETSTSPEYRSSDRTGYNAGNLRLSMNQKSDEAALMSLGSA